MRDCIEILALEDFEMMSEINEVVCELADKSEDDFQIDQSTRFFLGHPDNYKCSLRYCVNDNDSFSIEMGIPDNNKKVSWVALDKRDALSMAIELIAYAHNLDKMNGQNN